MQADGVRLAVKVHLLKQAEHPANVRRIELYAGVQVGKAGVQVGRGGGQLVKQRRGVVHHIAVDLAEVGVDLGVKAALRDKDQRACADGELVVVDVHDRVVVHGEEHFVHVVKMGRFLIGISLIEMLEPELAVDHR